MTRDAFNNSGEKNDTEARQQVPKRAAQDSSPESFQQVRTGASRIAPEPDGECDVKPRPQRAGHDSRIAQDSDDRDRPGQERAIHPGWFRFKVPGHGF